MTAYVKPKHPIASQIKTSQQESNTSTFGVGWKLVKTEGWWEIKSERYKERPCDIYISQPKLLKDCFCVSSGEVAGMAKTCYFAWSDICDFKIETLRELKTISE